MATTANGNGQNGNGRRVVALLAQVPWMPMITIVGWVAFAVSFYFTTRATLDSHTAQINQIMATRDKMVAEYAVVQKQMADGITQLNHTVEMRTQQTHDRQDSIEDAIRRMDVREDKIVQVLDNLYEAQQQMLRSIPKQ